MRQPPRPRVAAPARTDRTTSPVAPGRSVTSGRTGPPSSARIATTPAGGTRDPRHDAGATPGGEATTVSSQAPGVLRRSARRVVAAVIPRRIEDTEVSAQETFLERAGERARASRRLAWRRGLLTAAGLAVLGVAVWAVFFSSFLAVHEEEVRIHGTGGETSVSTADVTAIVDGVHGTPLLRLDLAALQGQLEQIDTVLTAEVRRDWPTGLEVTIVPRVPVAVMPGEGELLLLDADAVAVGTASERPEDLPMVTVPAQEAQTLAAVLDVLGDLPDDLRAQVVEASAQNPVGVELELDDGSRVRWGGATDSALKVEVLEILRTESASMYDISVPRAPIAVE